MAPIAGLIARFRKPLILAIAASAVVGAVSLWSYSKGYGRAEDKYKALQVSALEAQAKELEKAHARQIAAIQTKNRGSDAAKDIRNAPRPAGVECDAGNEWLQHLQNSVRIANDTAGTR